MREGRSTKLAALGTRHAAQPGASAPPRMQTHAQSHSQTRSPKGPCGLPGEEWRCRRSGIGPRAASHHMGGKTTSSLLAHTLLKLSSDTSTRPRSWRGWRALGGGVEAVSVVASMAGTCV